MKKKLLPGIVALAVLLIAGLGMNRSMANYGDLSDVALQNVLALADEENWENPDPGESGGGTPILWERIDSDCSHYFYGKANSKISVKINGVGVTIQIGAEGYAIYIYGDGKTHCIAGGNEQCKVLPSIKCCFLIVC